MGRGKSPGQNSKYSNIYSLVRGDRANKKDMFTSGEIGKRKTENVS